MAAHEFTADQIEAGIVHALREGDVQEIPGLIRLMATVDPHRAQYVHDTLRAGLAIANADDAEREQIGAELIRLGAAIAQPRDGAK